MMLILLTCSRFLAIVWIVSQHRMEPARLLEKLKFNAPTSAEAFHTYPPLTGGVFSFKEGNVRAITVFEDDDGNVVTVATGSPCFNEGIELLHRAIAELAKAAKEDHAEH